MEPIAGSTQPEQYRAMQATHSSLSPRPQKPPLFPHLEQPQGLAPPRWWFPDTKCAGEREPLERAAVAVARGRVSSATSSSSEDCRMGTLISANEHRTILGDLLLVKETMGCGGYQRKFIFIVVYQQFVKVLLLQIMNTGQYSSQKKNTRQYYFSISLHLHIHIINTR
jgi:hypothetical protein